MEIEFKEGGEKDGTVYINTYCGDYCFRIRHVRVNDGSLKEYGVLAEELDWIEDDRVKLFIFIMIVKGMTHVDAFNSVLSRQCLQNGIYLNMYNAGGMNEEKKYTPRGNINS